SKQLNFPELVVENGSGLSRKERISARHMGQLLLAAFNSPVMPEFISSLPIAAVDGTLKNRFTDTPVKELAHLKTGALNNVRALAGYLLDKMGRRVIVVFFVNHDQAGHSRVAMDALVQWVYNRQ
ncbi:MAG: D-alanyl-D-alanine carboxypeptidase, partial [Pseudomonadota bacterium]